MVAPADWTAELAWLRKQQQLRRFREALDRKHGRGKVFIPGTRVEKIHLMTPEERRAAFRRTEEIAAPHLEAAVRFHHVDQPRQERECEAGRWRLASPRPRARRRRTASCRAAGVRSGQDPGEPPGVDEDGCRTPLCGRAAS
jgi:hypothetical protein